ncbi:membrane protein insertion efficiency factor YidD [Iodidimonas muriae]|uniref:membrane protein insertion efficiency factor YidD n=1 Tax=Iodidimonas muriae TaxID=261467 RepID=UPI001231020E|nr:membrane protein insertion efficiency factor YidD [Iodidimonas muriae]
MSLLGHCLIFFVRAYQLVLSPLLGPSCRYQPTCSAYAIEAVRRHGGRRGGWMAIRRIGRCHPFGGFGYDPVPDHDHFDKPSRPDRTDKWSKTPVKSI